MDIRDDSVIDGSIVFAGQYELQGIQFRRNPKADGTPWSAPLISISSNVDGNAISMFLGAGNVVMKLP